MRVESVGQWQLRAVVRAAAVGRCTGRRCPPTRRSSTSRARSTRTSCARGGADAERLGSIGRVTAERHGAIRVGTPRRAAAGRADLRGAGHAPGRLLRPARGRRQRRPRGLDGVPADRRPRSWPATPSASSPPCSPRPTRGSSTPDLRARLEAFLAARELFPPELLDLADRAEAERRAARGATPNASCSLAVGGVRAVARTRRPGLVRRRWSGSPPSRRTSAGVRSTHINHLTPRVLDIDELYRADDRPRHRDDRRHPGPAAMGAARTCCCGRPPSGPSPSPARMRTPDGTCRQRRAAGAVRRGRGPRHRAHPGGPRPLRRAGRRGRPARRAADRRPDAPHRARRLGGGTCPAPNAELAAEGLAYFTYRVAADRPPRRQRTARRPSATCSSGGWVRPSPSSTRTSCPARPPASSSPTSAARAPGTTPRTAPPTTSAWLAGAVGRHVHDPFALVRPPAGRVARSSSRGDLDGTHRRDHRRPAPRMAP